MGGGGGGGGGTVYIVHEDKFMTSSLQGLFW